jgi:hypothetical protein
MNNVKPCCFIYNIVIDRSHVRFEGMFVNVYFEGCKEWEYDRFYVQYDSPAIVLELLIVSYVEMWTPISG